MTTQFGPVLDSVSSGLVAEAIGRINAVPGVRDRHVIVPDARPYARRSQGRDDRIVASEVLRLRSRRDDCVYWGVARTDGRRFYDDDIGGWTIETDIRPPRRVGGAADVLSAMLGAVAEQTVFIAEMDADDERDQTTRLTDRAERARLLGEAEALLARLRATF